MGLASFFLRKTLVGSFFCTFLAFVVTLFLKQEVLLSRRKYTSKSGIVEILSSWLMLSLNPSENIFSYLF